MTNLEKERRDLALAETHISEGDRRVTAQIALVQLLTSQGRDTDTAKDLLRVLEQTLVQWHEHRLLILDAIARRQVLAS